MKFHIRKDETSVRVSYIKLEIHISIIELAAMEARSYNIISDGMYR